MKNRSTKEIIPNDPDKTDIVRKTSFLDLNYLHALNSTLKEWDSEEDTQAYKEI